MIDFLEYSRNIPWNIPYSKISQILIVYLLFWNIPGIFHIPNFSIFRLCTVFFGIFLVVFHIPQLFIFSRNKFFMEYFMFIFSNQNLILHGKSNFWIFLGYSIFQNFYISIVYLFFWNIPGIFHIPNISIFPCWSFILEYSIFEIFIFHGIFHGIFRGIFHGIFHFQKWACFTGA